MLHLQLQIYIQIYTKKVCSYLHIYMHTHTNVHKCSIWRQYVNASNIVFGLEIVRMVKKQFTMNLSPLNIYLQALVHLKLGSVNINKPNRKGSRLCHRQA